jgi:transposase
MSLEPYRSAHRVFWIVDNGSSHRGAKAAAALQQLHPNLVLVHLPVHASWLNQIEIFLSILQRRLLTPNDFESVAALAERIAAFEKAYNLNARPFDWRFTRRDLLRSLKLIRAAA